MYLVAVVVLVAVQAILPARHQEVLHAVRVRSLPVVAVVVPVAHSVAEEVVVQAVVAVRVAVADK